MFKTCKPFNSNDPIKPHTRHFPAAEEKTIQPNLRSRLSRFYNSRKTAESTKVERKR